MPEVVCQLEQVRLPVMGRAPLIDWRVHSGEVWLLDGDVGSGKTTLIKLLTGLIKPAAGRVSLFGADIHRLSHRKLLRLRERLGVVFERDGLIASWTVGDNLMLPLRYRDGRAAPATLQQRIASELVAMGESERLLDQRVSQLTGRQRRRVALIRTVLLQPELVLMDDLPLYLHADGDDTGAVLERLTPANRTLIACAPAAWARHFPGRRVLSARLAVDGFATAAAETPRPLEERLAVP